MLFILPFLFLQTSLMGITETVENEPLAFAVFFRKYNTTDIYICRAETKTSKEDWIQVLKDVIALQTIILNRCNNFIISIVNLEELLSGIYLANYHSVKTKITYSS